MTQIVPDDRARQGPPGRPVLGVLIGALALLAIAITGYMIWVGSTSPTSESQDASRAAVTGSTTGSNNNPSARVKPENPAYPAPGASSTAGPPKQ